MCEPNNEQTGGLCQYAVHVSPAVLGCRLRERTHSLWAFLMSEKQNYLNPFYSPAYSEAHPVLEPSTLPYHFKSVQLVDIYFFPVAYIYIVMFDNYKKSF